MKKETGFSTYRLTFIAVAAAMVYVLTMFRFPLLGSKVHFANAMCLLSGLLLGPVGGGLAAGIGSALNDMLYGGYGVVDALITLVSKFAMAFLCALAAGRHAEEDALGRRTARITLACAAGAFSYVALYMLKTFIFQRFVYGFPGDAVWATMLAKLPASLINAAFAVIVTPIVYTGLLPPLKKAGLLRHLTGA